jgi:hypothetical protein
MCKGLAEGLALVGAGIGNWLGNGMQNVHPLQRYCWKISFCKYMTVLPVILSFLPCYNSLEKVQVSTSPPIVCQLVSLLLMIIW